MKTHVTLQVALTEADISQNLTISIFLGTVETNVIHIMCEKFAVIVSTGVMSNISPQKNARTPEQNISLRNLCKNLWLEETAILICK
jgi:ABC-type methionine transport system ATPase subunit